MPGRSSSSFRLLASASGAAVVAVGFYLYASGGYPLLTEEWTFYPIRYVISTNYITKLPVLPAILAVFGFSTVGLAVMGSCLTARLAPFSLGLAITWLTTLLPPSYRFFHTVKHGLPLGFLVYIATPPPQPYMAVMGVVATCLLADLAFWSSVVWTVSELSRWLRSIRRRN